MTFKITKQLLLVFIFSALFTYTITAQNFKAYKGEVVNSKTNKGLEYVTLTIESTNLTTVTNSEGEFLLKVPNTNLNNTLKVSLLGYKTQRISLKKLQSNGIKIKLEPAIVTLSEVNIATFKNAEALVRKVFENKKNTQANQSLLMTTFYRETIKRRNRNVSLTEAVLKVIKYPYSDYKPDAIKLHKARKSTDYKRLDTLTLKLQGGPFSTLYIDTMKYPEYFFNEDTISEYEYSFENQTTIDNKNVSVVSFKPKFSTLNIGYFGKLYIDTANFALVSLDYAMDLTNKAKVKNMLVKKKPRDVVVIPLQANYKIDYKLKNGKWYYSYSNFMLKFKVNKKRQWFNKIYTLASEMAVTDWEINSDNTKFKAKNRLKPNVIIADAISGFYDVDFWGKYNVIEPDKSIESAIKKILKNLNRNQSKF